MAKFKIGDEVRLVGDRNSVVGKNRSFGKIATIKSVDNFAYPYLLNEADYRWRDSELELVNVNEKIVITHDGKTTTATMYNSDGIKTVATAKCAPEDEFNFRIGAEIAMARLVDKLVFANFNIIKVVFREGERSYSYKTRHQTAKVGMDIIVPVGTNNKELRATVTEIIPGATYEGEYEISAMKEIDVVEAPKLYNGKVVCIKNSTGNAKAYTVGKIYQFKDGLLTDNFGQKVYNYNLGTFSNFAEWNAFSSSDWIEIVE